MKLFLFIIIILSVLGILEYKAIVPTSSFGVLLALDTIANFIKSLNIHAYYLILPDITITVQGLLSLFLVLFIVSNLVLFGGVYWSKFAHMFYKPGAAIQKNLAEADGSRDNLPPPADAPEQFGLGIKREQPKHY